MIREMDFITEKNLRSKMAENELGIATMQMVKEILLLEGTEFATTEMVATYFDVGIETVNSVIKDHREELESNGLRVYKGSEIADSDVMPFKDFTKNRANYKFILNDGTELSVGGKGITLFSKRAILNVGMLLRDSDVAKEIQKELTGFEKSNLTYRKEIKFKKCLDDAIDNIRRNIRYEHFFDEHYVGKETNVLHKTINKAIDSITTYESQYSVCDNKYRIDFYFPKLNIAIEYDENYHKGQQNKDKQREYEIIRDIYIDKYYNDVSKEDLREWKYDTIEEYFDDEYKNKTLFYSFDFTRFARIREGYELEDISYVISMIAITSSSIIDSRGMSCKYEDLL